MFSRGVWLGQRFGVPATMAEGKRFHGRYQQLSGKILSLEEKKFTISFD